MPRRGENIRKRKDGRWEGRYIKNYDTNGEAKYVSVYGKSYLEVKQKLITATSGIDAGTDNHKNKSLLFREVLLLWLENNRVKLKPSTYSKYYRIIEKHLVPVIGNTPISNVNTQYLNNILCEKSNNGRLDSCGGLSPTYVRTMGFILKSTMVFAQENNYCNALKGTVIMPLKTKSQLKVLSLTEQERLENACCKYSSNKDVVSIAASNYAVFGLCKDGTVFDSQLVNGYFFWKDKASVCVPGWRDIIAVSGGGRNGVSVAGLRKDGTVVIYDNDKIILDPNIWKNIVQISFGGGHLVGLKSDGTVVAAGDNDHGQCNVSDWNDIVHISAGSTHTVGVKADGTVIAVGENDAGQCDVFGWTNVERVSAGVRHTVGLGRDGNVVATAYRGPSDVYGGQCEVSHWSELDVIDISAGAVQTIGIRRDGKLISTVNKLKGDFARDDQFSRLFRIVGCQLFDDYDSLASERETKFVVRTKKRAVLVFLISFHAERHLPWIQRHLNMRNMLILISVVFPKKCFGQVLDMILTMRVKMDRLQMSNMLI